MDDAVHMIHGGRVVRGTVRSRLPECVDGLSWYEPGIVPHAPEALAAVAAVVTRCTPCARVYLGPRLWSVAATADVADYDCRPTVRHLPDGRTEYEHHGRACWGDRVILCTSAARLPAVLATVHHEVWHEVEHTRLSAADVAAVDRAAARGDPRPGDYLASAIERRARLYESRARARDEGWRPASLLGWPLRRVDRVCAYVHSGALAKDVTRGRMVLPRVGPAGLAFRWVAATVSAPATAGILPALVAALVWWRS